MPSRSRREMYVLAVIGVIAVLSLLYSVLVVRNLFAWVGIVIPFIFLYLTWRFVRAHERIADALESGGTARDGVGASDE